MNVLFVEDRGDVSYYVTKALQERGHNVIAAYDYDDAESHWQGRSTVSVDCIILDLNLPSEGLAPEDQQKSRGGLLSGWLWLTGKVLKDEPIMRGRVAIYSAFLEEFKTHVESVECEGLMLVPKGESTSSLTAIVNWVDRLPAKPPSQSPKVE